MRLVRAAAAVVSLLVVAACSPGDEPDPSGPTSRAAPSPTAAALPLPLAEPTGLETIRTSGRPVWTSDDLPREQRNVQVVGDLMLLLTSPGPTVVDLTSGRTLWRVPRGEVDLGELGGLLDEDDDAVLVDTPSGPVVVLSYFAFGCAFGCPAGVDQQRGVVAVDPRTGDVVWGNGLTRSAQADYIRPEDRSGGLPVTVKGVSSTTVVVGIGTGAVLNPVVDSSRAAYVVGLDPATGERRWAVRDLLVQSVAGDVVVAVVNDERDPSLVGIDAGTGTELWRVRTSSRLASVSPRVIVLGDQGGELLDSRTGQPLLQQLPPGTRNCARWVRGDLDVACLWDDPDDLSTQTRMVTLAADRELSLSAPLPEERGSERKPETIQDGVITVGDDALGPGAVDAAGRMLLPADIDQVIASLDDRYVVLGDGAIGSGYERLEVLRRR